MKKILLLFALIYGCANMAYLMATDTTSFVKLAKQYDAGDHSDSLKVLIINGADSSAILPIQNFLENTKQARGDEYFFEKLTSICLLKQPKTIRYTGVGHDLFLKYVKFGETALMTDFFESWTLISKQAGIADLQNQAIQLTQNYVQNYLSYFTIYYQKPVFFSSKWVNLGLLHCDFPEKEVYKKHVKMIDLFQINRIDDMIVLFDEMYMHPAIFPKNMKGAYYCGAELKLILIGCNRTQCQAMITMLDKSGVPKDYDYTLKLFKGKMQYLDYYNKKN